MFHYIKCKECGKSLSSRKKCKCQKPSAASAGSPLYGAIANKRDPGRVLIQYPGGEIGMPWREATEWANRIKEAARQADQLEMDER